MTSKKDETEVEFVATKRDDGKCYTVTVLCEAGLDDDEFAACLVAFAKDIEDGDFQFDNDSGGAEVLSQ